MKTKKIISIILAASMISTVVQSGVVTLSNELSTLSQVSTNVVGESLVISYDEYTEFNGVDTLVDISEEISNVESLEEGAILIDFNTTSTESNQVLFSMTDSNDSNSHIIIKLLDGALRYEVKEKGVQKIGYTYKTITLNDGENHRIMISEGDRGSGLYIDGMKVFSTTSQVAFFSDVTTPDTMSIGAIKNSSNTNGTQFFNGVISEVSVYDSELSEEESIQLTKVDKILSYDINSEFNGVDTLVNISEDIAIVESLEEGAISVEFNTTSTSANQVLFSMTDTSESNSHIFVKLLNGKLRYEVRENNTQIIGYTYKDLLLNDGENHKILVNQGQDKSELYVDGVKVFDTTAEVGYFSEVTNPDAMTIGAIRNKSNINGTQFFDGTIKSVDIYRRELSEEEAIKEATLTPNVEEEYNRIMNLIHGEEDINIVFTGDSITHGPSSTNGYRSYSEHLNERISGEAIDGNIKSETFIINTGVSNAKTTDILNHFDEVVTHRNPDIVFVMIGMNDCVTITLDAYEQNLREIVKRIRETGAIPVLQTCNIARSSRPQLPKYMATMKRVAEEEGVYLIDHYEFWVEKHQENPGISTEWLNDAVHPNQIGQLEMAKLIMREFELDTEDSFTYNLTYPLTTQGEYVDKNDIGEYPRYVGIDEVTPVVKYEVSESFSSSYSIDKSEDIELIENLKEGSIVARFKLTTDENAQTLISLSDGRDASNNTTLAINEGKIHYEVREGGNKLKTTSTQDGYNDGEWHTVILTTDDEGTKIYVDGELIISSSINAFFADIKTPNNLNIGRNVHNQGGEWYYNGEISYIDIYSEALTENQIELITELSKKSEEAMNEPASMNLAPITAKTKANSAEPWVFLGDEDTSSSGDTYGYRNFIEYFEERVRWELRGSSMNSRRKFMINSGVDGATSTEILSNFNEWAAIHEPSVVSVMIGGRETVSVEEFEVNLRAIVEKIEDIGAIPMLQTPVIKLDDVSEYIDVIRKVAEEEQLAFIDHYNYWSSIEVTQPQINNSWLTEEGSPNHRGHLEIAKRMLSEIGILGGLVDRFNIPYEN